MSGAATKRMPDSMKNIFSLAYSLSEGPGQLPEPRSPLPSRGLERAVPLTVAGPRHCLANPGASCLPPDLDSAGAKLDARGENSGCGFCRLTGSRVLCPQGHRSFPLLRRTVRNNPHPPLSLSTLATCFPPSPHRSPETCNTPNRRVKRSKTNNSLDDADDLEPPAWGFGE